MDQDKDPIGWYTLVHLGAGVLARRMGLPPALAVGLAVIYELIEDGIIETFEIRRWGKEGKENAIIDIGVFAAGYFLEIE